MAAEPSFAYTQLVKQRKSLVDRSKLLEPGTLDDVIASIDRMIAEESRSTTIRVSSAPQSSINELLQQTEDARWQAGQRTARRRIATDPTHSQLGSGLESTRWDPNKPTVRLINSPEADPTAVQRESGSAESDDGFGLGGSRRESSPARSGDRKRSRFSTRRFTGYGSTLEPIEEKASPQKDAPQTPRSGRSASSGSRIRNWFRRSFSSGGDWESDNGPTPPSKDSPFKRKAAAKKPTIELHHRASNSGEEEFPMRGEVRDKAKKPSKFLRFFGVKETESVDKAAFSMISKSASCGS